jgi:hypothetical protein
VLAVVYFGGVATTQEIFHALTPQEHQPQLAIVDSTLIIAPVLGANRKGVSVGVTGLVSNWCQRVRRTLTALLFPHHLQEERE